MMDYKPRPYKGRAAELAELDALRTSTTDDSLPQKDTVVEAGRKCLIIGGLTTPLLFGGPFLMAAFVLGIYAMATDRMKQGMKIALLATILMLVIPAIMYGTFLIIGLGITASFIQKNMRPQKTAESVLFEKIEPLPSSTLSALTQQTFARPSLKKLEPRQRVISSTPVAPRQQPQPTINAETIEPAPTRTASKSNDEKRQDYIIPRGELTSIPGFGTVNINHNHAYVYFSTFKGQKPYEIRKVRGLHPTDTNRTLLSRAGSGALYFVDTIVGADKIQVAVITE